MSRVVIFFEGKVITITDPLPDYRLKDLVAIHLLTHLSIGIAGVIENEWGDEVVSNTGPNMESSLILFFWPSATMLDMFWFVPRTLFPDNTELALRTPSEVTLVCKNHIFPVLWIRSFL